MARCLFRHRDVSFRQSRRHFRLEVRDTRNRWPSAGTRDADGIARTPYQTNSRVPARGTSMRSRMVASRLHVDVVELHATLQCEDISVITSLRSTFRMIKIDVEHVELSTK